MAPQRQDGRRPTMVDPDNIGDAFASGLDVQEYEDWLRLVWWVDIPGNARGLRRKVASITVAKALLPVVVQELRGAAGHGRDTRRH